MLEDLEVFYLRHLKKISIQYNTTLNATTHKLPATAVVLNVNRCRFNVVIWETCRSRGIQRGLEKYQGIKGN